MKLFGSKDCSCKPVVALVRDANSYGHYFANMEKLNAWEEDGILELYAGDSYLNDIPAHCQNEDRYTISHYYRCKKCGNVFFIGFCCRGGFKFKVEDFPTSYAKSIEEINFENIMKDHEQLGIRFHNRQRFR